MILNEYKGTFKTASIHIKTQEVKKSAHSQLYSFKSIIMDMFLPQDYPESVTIDYTQYQIFDTLQGYCSNVYNVLATKSLLKGVGVGDSSTSIQSALLVWLIKDGLSMVGRILFTWRVAPFLDSQAKLWRFVADIMNDLALWMDLVSPFAFTRFQTHVLISISTVFKALVGVTGGATKAALTVHFAKQNNTGDLNAKDGSQETLVGLLGMLTGSLIVTLFDDVYLWPIAVLLTICHLLSNYFAVHSVILTTLNRHRLTLVCKEFVESGQVLSPLQVNSIESIWQDYIKSIQFGVSLSTMISKDPNLVKSVFNSRKQQSQSQIKEYRGQIYIWIHSNANLQDLIYLYSRGVFMSMNPTMKANASIPDKEEWIDMLQCQGWNLERNELNDSGYRFDSFLSNKKMS